MYAHARARVQWFYVFAFTSSPFGGKVLSKCLLRVKVSPFCLHLFFAIGVVQCIVFQLVAVKVKVNAEFAFTLNRLIYSLLQGEVKGEGKNGKFAECACAYIRVGACPARRMEWEFVRGGEVLRETREEVAKSGDVLRESRLVFFAWSGGGEEKRLLSLFPCLQKLNLGWLGWKTPRQTDFFGENRDLGREFLASWREKHPEKGGICPQSGRIGRKRAVLGGKSQGGDEAKKRT